MSLPRLGLHSPGEALERARARLERRAAVVRVQLRYAVVLDAQLVHEPDGLREGGAYPLEDLVRHRRALSDEVRNLVYRHRPGVPEEEAERNEYRQQHHGERERRVLEEPPPHYVVRLEEQRQEEAEHHGNYRGGREGDELQHRPSHGRDECEHKRKGEHRDARSDSLFLSVGKFNHSARTSLTNLNG